MDAAMIAIHWFSNHFFVYESLDLLDLPTLRNQPDLRLFLPLPPCLLGEQLLHQDLLQLGSQGDQALLLLHRLLGRREDRCDPALFEQGRERHLQSLHLGLID